MAKIQYEKNLAEHIKTDNKSFWYHVRSNTNTKETVGNLEDPTGSIKTDNKGRAEILNSFFTSVFSLKKTKLTFPNLRHEVKK